MVFVIYHYVPGWGLVLVAIVDAGDKSEWNVRVTLGAGLWLY